MRLVAGDLALDQLDRFLAEANGFVEIALGVADQPGQLVVEFLGIGIFVDPIVAELNRAGDQFHRSLSLVGGLIGQMIEGDQDVGLVRIFLDRLLQQLALLGEVVLLAVIAGPVKVGPGAALLDFDPLLDLPGQLGAAVEQIEGDLHHVGGFAVAAAVVQAFGSTRGGRPRGFPTAGSWSPATAGIRGPTNRSARDTAAARAMMQ